MTPADLLFIALVLSTLVVALVLLVRLVRGRRADAWRLALRHGVLLALYLLVVIGVAFLTPRRWVAVGEEQRFDDWALTVTAIEREGTQLVAHVRVANHGRGRAQAALDAKLLLVTTDGRAIPPEPGTRPLTERVAAGDAYLTECRYVLPAGAEPLGLDIHHGDAGLPIIGDRGAPFATRPLVKIG